MLDIVCTKPAYDRLVKTGLDKRILAQKDAINDILIHNDISKAGRALIKEARKEVLSTDRKISERTAAYNDILAFERRVDEEPSINFSDFTDLLIQHSHFLGLLVLGNELFNAQEYCFHSTRALSEAVTAFCIGEKWNALSFFRDKFAWRQGDCKNELTNGYHGDCWFHQTDVSGNERKETTLFGEVERFDAWKDVSGCVKGVNADYSDWGSFLMANLRYAEAIGKKTMPEIVNWRDILEQAGSVGTQTTEAMFGESNPDWILESLLENPLLNADTKEKLKVFPIAIKCNSGIIYYPCVLEKKLQYIREDKDGKIELPFLSGIFENKRFSPYIVYEQADLPELLKGTYKLFARDRSLIPRIIDGFLAQN